MKEPFYKNSKSYLICGLIGVVGVLYLGLAMFLNSVSTYVDVGDGGKSEGLTIFETVRSALGDLKYGFKISRFFPILLVILLFVVLVIMLYFAIKDNFLNENFHRLDKAASEEKPVEKGVVVNDTLEFDLDAVAEAAGAPEITEKVEETVGAVEEVKIEEAKAEEKAEDDPLDEKPIEIKAKELTPEQKKAMARKKRLRMRGPLGMFFRFEDRHKYLARIIPIILSIVIYILLYHTSEYKGMHDSITELVASWQSIITQYKMMNIDTDMVAKIHIGLGLILVFAGELFYIGSFCFNFILDTLNED